MAYLIFAAYVIQTAFLGYLIYRYHMRARDLEEKMIELAMSRDVFEYNSVRKERNFKKKDRPPVEPDLIPEMDVDDKVFEKMLNTFEQKS